MTMIQPGATIGIIGGGQLGRMLSMAAANLGYRSAIYAPESSGPAADVSARWVQGNYDDADALQAFAQTVDVVTYEFENIPVAPLESLRVPLAPHPRALATAQDRATEKAFVQAIGGRPAPWAVVSSREDLDAALNLIGTPAILKTRRFGYDGKGQARLKQAADADEAWAALAWEPAVLEGFVAFEREFSILIARGSDGATAIWDPVLNVHEDGILALSTVPAGLAGATVEAAKALAEKIVTELDYVGVLAIEFFDTDEGPVFNEMAPRVHNSGHWTIEGAVTSQFENHIRAICGLPLGSTARAAPRVEMRNLIGAQAGDWDIILSDPAAHLHLYGKGQARPGRKMGHVTKLFFD
ncbi:5-(carboxyamino)imidazole ribonucleotide synthase [Sphingomonadaceae bacterium G21617-S1]|uniref:5-(carboxyamino)imidazole ribonucleotide synthase n=1 Tax=Rhizorhabdus sp. TaxID=1968843 RepID=UPI0012023617|nr:5-(carboxyamino)imidazole ribonucleotide synthase [Rhizorhabdus sp.]MBD3760628.1 5-(carboxyamino)imidazole ribonucleotide synthase [Rhizorhabdus sp.]MCZ4340015.1 5-(carboxyamino)imidazole ribonucleotide synthase [Sphingomonadaceae bacterium G21617-S1]TAK10037.1 MAG: 5-(carboxyamino)imidazole ribonucleotide synthase [Rhizorhabdus sp.]